jgi:hypothetical protein
MMQTRARDIAHEIRFLVAFFRVVPPVPPLMTASLVVVAAAGVVAVVADPGRAERAVFPLLLLQMFASSSGFALPARRGYYDLLLTRGIGRTTIALLHWVSAVSVGVCCWIALGIAERVSGPAGGTVLAPGTAVAMTLVSVLPWALTVGLPRFSGAIAWLMATAALGTVPGTDPRLWIGGDEPASVAAAAGALLNPAMLVGRRVDDGTLAAAAPAIGVAAAAMALALRWIARAGFRLEAAQ